VTYNMLKSKRAKEALSLFNPDHSHTFFLGTSLAAPKDSKRFFNLTLRLPPSTENLAKNLGVWSDVVSTPAEGGVLQRPFPAFDGEASAVAEEETSSLPDLEEETPAAAPAMGVPPGPGGLNTLMTNPAVMPFIHDIVGSVLPESARELFSAMPDQAFARMFTGFAPNQ